MRTLRIIGLLALLAISSDMSWAQRRGGPPTRDGRRDRDQQGRRFNGQDNDQENGRGRRFGPGPHIGDWLRQHQGLSLEDQERALQSDPGFRQLDSRRQELLRQRLRKFNELPSERQERLLDRAEKLEHLTPEQQSQTSRLYSNFRRLPRDRRSALADAYRELRAMSPDEQRKRIDSEDYRHSFSDSERDILRDITGLANSNPANK